jgi:ketopantoate reductase
MVDAMTAEAWVHRRAEHTVEAINIAHNPERWAELMSSVEDDYAAENGAPAPDTLREALARAYARLRMNCTIAWAKADQLSLMAPPDARPTMDDCAREFRAALREDFISEEFREKYVAHYLSIRKSPLTIEEHDAMMADLLKRGRITEEEYRNVMQSPIPATPGDAT